MDKGNILKQKIYFFCGREEKKEIFRKENYTFLAEEKKKGERKGGKYLRRQIYCFAKEKKKKENIWRR